MKKTYGLDIPVTPEEGCVCIKGGVCRLQL